MGEPTEISDAVTTICGACGAELEAQAVAPGAGMFKAHDCIQYLRARLVAAEAVCEASRKCLAVYGSLPANSRPKSWADWRDAMLAFDALTTAEEPTE